MLIYLTYPDSINEMHNIIDKHNNVSIIITTLPI